MAGARGRGRIATDAVQRGFRAYLDVLAARGATPISVPDLPDEPVVLSYLVAASVIVDLTDRQGLLAEPDAVSRLTAERAMLAREAAMLREFGTDPAPELRTAPDARTSGRARRLVS